MLAAQDALEICALGPLCFVAAVAGDAVGFAFGRHAGRRLYARPDSRWFRRAHLRRAEALFARHGGMAVVLARFVPVVCTLVPATTGASVMRYTRFAAFNVLGALLWAVGITLAGYLLGSTISNLDRYVLPASLAIALLTLIPSLWHWSHLRRVRQHEARGVGMVRKVGIAWV